MNSLEITKIIMWTKSHKDYECNDLSVKARSRTSRKSFADQANTAFCANQSPQVTTDLVTGIMSKSSHYNLHFKNKP